MQLRYKVQNCLAYGSAPIEVDLTQPGLTLIQGKHLSSRTKSTNGTGKSSLLNSVFWIFYGKYPKGYSKADMVNEETKGNCLGEGWVTTGDKQGYIVRGISCKEMTFNDIEVTGDFLLFFIDGKDMRGATQTDTQAVIEAFMGLDYDSFVTAALFTVDEDSFSSKTSGKQEEIFSKLLHLEDLEDARKRVKDRQKEVKNEVANCDNKIDKYNSHILREQDRLSKVADSLAEWKVQQEAKEARLESQIDSTKGLIDTTTQKSGALEETIEDETDNLADMEEKIQQVDTATLTTAKATVSEKIRANDTEIGAVGSKIIDLRREIKQAQSMHGVAICDKCFSEVDGEHLYSIIAEKNTLFEEKETLLQSLKGVQTGLQSALQKADMELRAVDSLKNDVVRQVAQIDRLESEQKTLIATVESDRRTLADLNNRIEILKKEKPQQGEDATGIRAEIAKLESSIADVNDSKALFLTELDDLDFCEKMFGSSGIRNLLVRSVIPKLNEQVNRFAEILTDGELQIEFRGEVEVGSGRRTESRNKLDVRVLDRFGSEKYCMESGGEKRRVDICVNLALNYLVASRIGLPFVMFDEFYASLDKRGEMKVMELLEELKKDIPSIFVISNDESISSNDFDSVWTVCRKGKQSWIEKE